ncbi:NucA/NucB deoxyribonuclease domain-containing protein [Streptomyces sp. NPDC001153]
MRCVGRTSCDEHPFASLPRGQHALAGEQRTITWVTEQENISQGGAIITPGAASSTSWITTPST